MNRGKKERIEIDLKVNKKTVEMNPFVQKIISNAVLGMVKSLREVNKVKEILIKIKK